MKIGIKSTDVELTEEEIKFLMPLLAFAWQVEQKLFIYETNREKTITARIVDILCAMINDSKKSRWITDGMYGICTPIGLLVDPKVQEREFEWNKQYIREEKLKSVYSMKAFIELELKAFFEQHPTHTLANIKEFYTMINFYYQQMTSGSFTTKADQKHYLQINKIKTAVMDNKDVSPIIKSSINLYFNSLMVFFKSEEPLKEEAIRVFDYDMKKLGNLKIILAPYITEINNKYNKLRKYYGNKVLKEELIITILSNYEDWETQMRTDYYGKGITDLNHLELVSLNNVLYETSKLSRLYHFFHDLMQELDTLY